MLLMSDSASCIRGHKDICAEINNLFGLFAFGKCLEDLVKLRGSKVIRLKVPLSFQVIISHIKFVMIFFLL